MKKNLLSILILALLVVNVVLTAIMMFSVMGMTRKTTALVTDIASALSLELTDGSEAVEEEVVIPMEDVALHNIADKMTIPLKKGEDGESHFVLVQVSFSMNTKDKGYKKYGATLAEKDPILKDAIIETFGNYTIDEVNNNQPEIKESILERVQTIFDSQFIFDVSFGEITPQ